MRVKQTIQLTSLVLSLFATGMISGCAHYEVNNGRGDIPGYYIRSEMQEADRAVESARRAGKDTSCPQAFKEAEDLKNRAYDVFRACHTEEGAALAKQATAKANALCPPQAAEQPATAAPVESSAAPTVAAAAAPTRYKYCITLHIEYDIGRAIIRPQYHAEVARVGDFLKKYPSTTAVIEGHTDNVGDYQYNMELSMLRAENVVNYLVEKFGIDRSRLTPQGFGPTRPVADNASDAGKQQNRRIEAVIDCTFDVTKIEPPEKLCISMVMDFDSGKAEIMPKYHGEIAKVADYLNQNPTTTAVIEGHTDNVGSPEANLKLSQQRAENVVNFLVEKFGIDRSRLSAKGYGDTRRISYDDTAAGRQRNRRIDAVIDCVIKK